MKESKTSIIHEGALLIALASFLIMAGEIVAQGHDPLFTLYVVAYMASTLYLAVFRQR